MYTLSGSYYYFYKSLENNSLLNRIKLNSTKFYLLPSRVSCYIFLEDTELLVISKNPRDQLNYEKDTVRINLISVDKISEYV